MKNTTKILILAALMNACAPLSSIPYAFKPVGFTKGQIEFALKPAVRDWAAKSANQFTAIIDENCTDDANCSTIELVNSDTIEFEAGLGGVDVDRDAPKHAYGLCTAETSEGGIDAKSVRKCKDAARNGDVVKFNIKVIKKAAEINKLQQVVAHELGHAFGFGHKECGTLMYPKIGECQASEVTALDVAYSYEGSE